MFVAFEGPTKIVRVLGKGNDSVDIFRGRYPQVPFTAGFVYEFRSPEYESLIPFSERLPGSRAGAAIHIHHRV
jgi:hypothetical protein